VSPVWRPAEARLDQPRDFDGRADSSDPEIQRTAALSMTAAQTAAFEYPTATAPWPSRLKRLHRARSGRQVEAIAVAQKQHRARATCVCRKLLARRQSRRFDLQTPDDGWGVGSWERALP